MNAETRKAALKRLAQLIENPEHRSIDGYPKIKGKSGKSYEINPNAGWGRHHGIIRVSLDYGLTARDLSTAFDLNGVLDTILSAEEN